MSNYDHIPTPDWVNDTTEVVVKHPDGSISHITLSTPEAVSFIERTITEEVRLGSAALKAITLDLSTD